MPTKIKGDFKPDERSYNNLRVHGAIPEFVDYELPNFITYWMETGGKKKSWQMTLQRWMRSAWQGKAGRDWEYNRHKRQDSGSSGDLFHANEGWLKAIRENVEPAVYEGKRYRIPERPAVEVDPNKTTEDYLDELARMAK